MGPQRLIHTADQGHRRLACQGAHIHHDLRQMNAVLQILHQRAAPGLDIQHNRVRPGRQLLGKDGGNHQRNRVHGGGHIPQRVQRLVRRRQMSRLPHYSHAGFLHLAQEFLLRQADPKPGNGFQLVQRTAGMAQTPAAHLRHRRAAGRHQRRQHQRGRIPHATGGMLVHLDARDGGQIRHVAGIPHGQGELRGFLIRHAVQPDGHQQRRQLIIRHALLRRRIREEPDFLRVQRLPQLLFFYDLHHRHFSRLPPFLSSPPAGRSGWCP